MVCRCNNCMRLFDTDDDLTLMYDGEWFKGCPNCMTDGYLMEMDENG